MSRDINILALDLSLVRTGWAIRRCGKREFGSIAPRSLGMARIDHVRCAVGDLLMPGTDASQFADLVVLEGPALHAQGRGMCERWALRGVILYRLYELGVPTVEVPPALLKKYATAKGNATKDAMIAAAIRRFRFAGSDNNEADAWLLLAMAEAAYLGKDKREQESAAYQLQCLMKVDWPRVETSEA